MTQPHIDAVAAALLAARRDGIPADAAALAGALHDPADAFTVQDIVLRALGAPAFPRHWKAGGPGPGGVPSHAALPAVLSHRIAAKSGTFTLQPGA